LLRVRVLSKEQMSLLPDRDLPFTVILMQPFLCHDPSSMYTQPHVGFDLIKLRLSSKLRAYLTIW